MIESEVNEMKWKQRICMILCLILTCTGLYLPEPSEALAQNQSRADAGKREILNFNTDWLYSSVDYENGFAAKLDDSGFDKVSVPHANTILETHKGEDFPNQIAAYRFVSWYRRHFALPAEYTGRHITVDFEGVATNAEVYLNGVQVGSHKGAYTSFSVDITDEVYTDGRENVLAVRVDSQKQTQVPPEGGNVDYCLFGGIVRDVNMTVTDPVHVERVFVTTPDLTKTGGVVKNSVDILNSSSQGKTYTVETTVLDQEGNTVVSTSKQAEIPAGQETNVEMTTDAVSNPHLWDVDDPYLYTAVTRIKDGSTELDTYRTRFGMRFFEFKTGPDDGQFYLNGKQMEVIGINRHEQWPWIGRAVPDKLQVQDADLIKANGINAVRCSHYPQDPSFLDRCDEIGLLVVEEPPGWQHIGDEQWKAEFKYNLEELILRDRNHPSIISWGARPNESRADLPFNRECEAISKKLDPTRPTHGVRWEFALPGEIENNPNHMQEDETVVNDILTVNYRYPENPPHIPYMVTEHSNDWWGDGYSWAKDAESIKFIDSFAEVLDYFYRNDKVAGGFGWSMFDYDNEVNYTNTGHVFYSGLYDIFRHEKPVSYLYKSQMEPGEEPLIYISNSWTEEGTNTDKVYVMSNCDEIELFVNNVSKGKIKPNKYVNLPHPIFEFTGISFEAGELKAVGYIDGEKAGEYVRKTAGEPVRLIAEADYSTLTADGTDMTSVSVTAVDADGNRVPFADNTINVAMVSPEEGMDATLISEKDLALEGGRGAFLVQSVRDKTGTARFEVTAEGLEAAEVVVKVEPFTADNLVPVAESGVNNIVPALLSPYTVNDARKGTGLYQFSYQGSGWIYGAEKTAYQSDNHYSKTAGDTCSIRFVGTNLKYYGAKAPAHGIAAFAIDSGEEIKVDCYSGAREGSALLFDTGELQYGEHTLTIRVTGEKNSSASDIYINVDRVEVSSQAPKAVVDDQTTGTGDMQFNFSSGWQTSQAAGCYQGGNHWTETKDDTLEFKFTGTSVKYYTQKAWNLGIAAFSIDGGEETLVDLYQRNSEDQVMVYESGPLAKGEHILKVRATGDKSPDNNQNDFFVVVADRIDVFDEDESGNGCSHENTALINKADAACTQPGYSGDTRCRDCGKLIAKGSSTAALGHQWNNGEITTEPTYKEPGIKTYVCVRCQETKTEEVAKLECDHQGAETEIKNKKDASCTEKGYTGDTYCKRCDAKMEEGQELLPLGHQWDEGVITKEPTAEAEGIKTYTCTRCQETKTEAVPKKDPGPGTNPDPGPGTNPDPGPGTNPDPGPGTNPDPGPGTDPKPPTKGVSLRDNTSKAVYKVVDAKVVNGKVTGSVEYTKPSQTAVKTVSIPASVTINGGTYRVTTIAEKAFQNNRKLTKVTIGGNITSIGANAFYGCTKLKTVAIGKNVTSIGNSAFRKCSSLTKITIPAKVKKIGKQAFSGCKKLKNITIKTTKLTKKSVGSKAFQGISAKAVIKVPKKQLKTYKSILKARGIGKKVKIRK